MKKWNQTTEDIEAIVATGRPIVIVSGEGEIGNIEPYRGKLTVRAIKSRLTRERRGGDRWARVDTDDARALMGVL